MCFCAYSAMNNSLLLDNLNFACDALTIHHSLYDIDACGEAIDGDGIASSRGNGSTIGSHKVDRCHIVASDGNLVVTLANLQACDGVVADAGSTDVEAVGSA